MDVASTPAAAQSVFDSFAATQVVLREREARDRCWWADMADCFAEDSYIEISWFRGTGAEFAEQSQDMAARGVASRHRLGPPSARIAGDRAVVTLPAVVETYPSVDGSECILEAYCRLLYLVQRADDQWRIARMNVVYERDELRASVPGQNVSVDPDELTGLRVPYRLLTWTMARTGYTLSQELPGDDRPDLVKPLYDTAFAWAGLSK